MLNVGDTLDGKILFDDDDLVFDLVELNSDGTETFLVNAKSYSDIRAKRIWVDTVSRGTPSFSKTYRLRVWLSENVHISDTRPGADYPASTYKNYYASVKVSVYGDFQEKDMSLPATCFAYEETSLAPAGEDAYGFPYTSYELNTTTSGISSCKNYFLNNFAGDVSTAGDGYQTFCEGTGTINSNGYIVNFDELLSLNNYDVNWMSELQDNNVITYYEEKEKYYRLNTDEESVNTCMDYMLNDLYAIRVNGLAGTDYSNAVDGYRSFCEGTGTLIGSTFEEHLLYNFSLNAVDELRPVAAIRYSLISQSDVDNFVANGVLTELEPTVGLAITDYDIDTCGPDVVIPSKINGVNVISISGIDECSNPTSYKKFDNYTNTLEYRKNEYELSQSNSVQCYTGAFQDKGLTSVVIPNTIQYIDQYAFAYNNLTELVVPASVTEIGEYAFTQNYFETVDVKSAAILGDYSFYQGSGQIILFEYGGTCEQLKSYYAFRNNWPENAITSNNNACRQAATES